MLSLTFPGCALLEELERGRDRPDPRAAPPAIAAPSAAASDDAKPARAPLSKDLLRRMKVPPPTFRTQHLAVGRRLLGQLTSDALTLRSLPDGVRQRSIPLDQPRRVVRLADGSLLALTARQSIRVEHANAPEHYPRASLFPSSVVVADLVNPSRFWVVNDANAYHYDLRSTVAGMLAPSAPAIFADYDQRAFGLLASGAFLCTTPTGLSHFYPGARPIALPLDVVHPWRILPTHRPDRAWIARSDGQVTLVDLHPEAGKVHVRTSFTVEGTPFDAASRGPWLALLLLHQPDEGPWHFHVEAHRSSGKLAWKKDLEPIAFEGENWATELDAVGQIALSAKAGRVAIGGAERLTLLRLSDGVTVELPTDASTTEPP